MDRPDKQLSLTAPAYWEGVWQAGEMPKLVDLSDRRLRNHATLAFHQFFSDALRSASVVTGTLIEIGCAQSKWLPYFHKEHGLAVTGLDYTEIGCARARTLLRQAGCPGTIIRADMFDPPGDLLAQFDVVLSMGLVEHFPDTAAAVQACAALAKPGGIVITTIPNMQGIIGCGQRWLGKSVYEKHVPLGRDALRVAHERSGLSILRSEYLLSANFAVVNPNLQPRILNQVAQGLLVAATAAVWAVERISVRLPATATFSPYVACVARKSGLAPR